RPDPGRCYPGAKGGGVVEAMADDSGNRMAAGRYKARATLRHRDLRTFSEPLRARVPCRTSTLPCRMGKSKRARERAPRAQRGCRPRSLLCRLDSRIVLEELLVHVRDLLPLVGDFVFREDRLHRADGLACAT